MQISNMMTSWTIATIGVWALARDDMVVEFTMLNGP